MRRKIRSYLTCALAVCLLTSWTVTARAQSTATLQGTVTDQNGALVAGVKITVRNNATGIERATLTDESGNYQVAALPVGQYRIEVRADGFQTQVVGDLPVEVSRTVVQNFQLKVGGVTQQVNITAGPPVVETATTTVGEVINQKTVQEIPLNGRHFVDLGLLIPGSVTPPQNGFLTAPLRGQGSFAFNTAGNREDTVNFMINGINLNDMVQNQITFQPSINTVQEFKVDNSTFSAEYGRNSGAIVNIATRSGSNEWHGEAFEFLRNEVLDARNFFNADKPPFKRNQFGGALGSAIKRERTFFFFTYEGLRQRQGLAINSGVLSDAQRSQATDPVARKLIDLIPAANAVGAGGAPIFLGAATAPVDIDQWTGDVSHTLTKDDRLHGYYAFQRDDRRESTAGTTIPNFGDRRQAHRQVFTLNETHTFGPNLVNEARFGLNRIHITFIPNAKLNPDDFGIAVGVSEPIGLPRIIVNGTGLTFGGPVNEPQGRGDTTFVVSDTASYLRGRHSLKIGGEFRRFLNNNFARNIGSFTFANATNFLQGKASAFNTTLGSTSSSIATGALGLFVQDNFKWRPNVTFELGLRYDLYTSPTERFDRFVLFDPAMVSLVRVGSDIDQIYHTNNKNVQPRVGIAWDPFNDGKTSVRAGYSILSDQPVTNLITGLSGNPPLATPVTFASSTKTTTFMNALVDAGAAGLSPNSINQGFDSAYVQSWNLNVQREITPTLGIMVGYFGSKGTHLRIQRNINQPLNGVRPFTKLSLSSPILPGAAIGNIFENNSAGNSSYNALWIAANKRISHGIQFNASYTFSKSIDYNSLNSQGVVVQDSFNIRGDRGLSDFDARHRFVINWIYDLPFTGSRLVEGWQITGITSLQSGNPIDIEANISSLNGLSNIGKPDLIGPITKIGSPTQWFTNTVCDPRIGCPAAVPFAVPVSASGVFHFGSLGRNVLIGPGFSNTDFSVIKNIKLTEKLRVQFRAEAFDIFNHANFGQPAGLASPGSTSFGVIRSTRFPTGDSGSSRQIQFALKLIF